MSKFILVLLLLGSFSAFAQTKVITTSWDCELEVELRYVGRKVPEYAYCGITKYELNGTGYKGRAFLFSHLISRTSKLAAIAAFANLCEDLTLSLNDSGEYPRCVDKSPVKSIHSAAPFITREGLSLASDTSVGTLKEIQDARILDVKKFCKKLATENMRCEAINVIIGE